jgi:hypothetical protein
LGNPLRVTLYLVLILAANTKYSINSFFTPANCDVIGVFGNHKKCQCGRRIHPPSACKTDEFLKSTGLATFPVPPPPQRENH